MLLQPSADIHLPDTNTNGYFHHPSTPHPPNPSKPSSNRHGGDVKRPRGEMATKPLAESSKANDEETQLLADEDYDVYELDDRSRPIPRGVCPHCHRQLGQQRQQNQGENDVDVLWCCWERSNAPNWVCRWDDEWRHVTLRDLGFKEWDGTSVACAWQAAPRRLFLHLVPRPGWRALLTAIFLVLWASTFKYLVDQEIQSKPRVVPSTSVDAGLPVRYLDCTDSLWGSFGEGCGLNGANCRPFSNVSFVFRCNGWCTDNKTHFDPYHVGRLVVDRSPLVIGGGVGSPYRGDSFICPAAVHAGVKDGCGKVTLTGEYYQFFNSSQNNVDSISFPSYFPLSFTVSKTDFCPPLPGSLVMKTAFPLTIVFTVIISLLTTSPALMFFSAFIGVYTTCSFIRSATAGVTDMSLRVSKFSSSLPSVLCITGVLYLTIVRYPLRVFPASAALVKIGSWLLPFWLGSTTPLLGYHGTEAFKGWLLLIIIWAITGCTALLDGYFWHRLALFAALIVSPLLALAIDPNWKSNYLSWQFFAFVMLLPLLAPKHRWWFIIAFCLGIFTSGMALDGGLGPVLKPNPFQLSTPEPFPGAHHLLPTILPPMVKQVAPGHSKSWGIWFKFQWPQNATLTEAEAIRSGAVTGLSIMVNDVERFRGWFAEKPLEDMMFSWTRERGLNTADEFFRFGFLGQGGRPLRYTEAGMWFRNGSWSHGEGYY